MKPMTAMSIFTRLDRRIHEAGEAPRIRTDGEGRRTMRFLSVIRTDERAGHGPSERLMNEMGRLMEEMTQEGSLIRTAGLRPSSEGFRVRWKRGTLSTVDGPFTESKEVIGGYAILEAANREEALELTKRFLEIHGDEYELECEVRPLDGDEIGGTV